MPHKQPVHGPALLIDIQTFATGLAIYTRACLQVLAEYSDEQEDDALHHEGHLSE